ncbi:MAG TPA: hypothetical protein VIN04_08050 [Myxococcota bacterium]|jgi:hypothetical protein
MTPPRLGIAQRDDGTILFVPWYPLPRAWVVPDSARCAAIQQRARQSFAFAMGVGAAYAVCLGVGRLPVWTATVMVALLLGEWFWWTRRYARGLVPADGPAAR